MSEDTEFDSIIGTFEPSINRQAEVMLVYRKAEFYKWLTNVLVLTWAALVVPLVVAVWSSVF